mgnify:CR=1 FL=1
MSVSQKGPQDETFCLQAGLHCSTFYPRVDEQSFNSRTVAIRPAFAPPPENAGPLAVKMAVGPKVSLTHLGQQPTAILPICRVLLDWQANPAFRIESCNQALAPPAKGRKGPQYQTICARISSIAMKAKQTELSATP